MKNNTDDHEILTLPFSRQIIFKVVPNCNIACKYCYQLDGRLPGWELLPSRISPEQFCKCIDAVCQHAKNCGQGHINIVFQGGEPLLAPKAVFRKYFEDAQNRCTAYSLQLSMTVQTNGILISDEWCELLRRHECGVSVSIDGPAFIHDSRRITHRGKGTFEKVISGIKCAQENGLEPRALSVLHPALKGRELINLFTHIGIRSAGLIIPAHNYNYPDPQYNFDEAPYGRILIDAFDEWLSTEGELRIHNFDAVIQSALHEESSLDGIGVSNSSIISFAADGKIERGDAYGICSYDRVAEGDLISDMMSLDLISREQWKRWAGVSPDADCCKACDVRTMCYGGMLEHRYSKERGFNNPSYYCTDLKVFYRHVRQRLYQCGVKSNG